MLSVVSERWTNYIKMKRSELRVKCKDKDEDRNRQFKIMKKSVVLGFVVALAMKADMFAILGNADAPWETLGWVQMHGHRWVRSSAVANGGAIVRSLGGCLVTGAALTFGSKFWHDVLGNVYELKEVARRIKAPKGGSADG
jgi:hypothetical protein